MLTQNHDTAGTNVAFVACAIAMSRFNIFLYDVDIAILHFVICVLCTLTQFGTGPEKSGVVPIRNFCVVFGEVNRVKKSLYPAIHAESVVMDAYPAEDEMRIEGFRA